ncbi:MAG: hypothetical protein KKH41_01955 [Candidatus Thermoplasmatota archaeon]|nr:hypothetical protein [Euryarchaeota archaeon]MBU4031328.1 hypothetical protein [Candidatus Thermoplasmatota archaeon]MBU4071879.1 hypothetical protein [Candidatus Thermoplasmatota archaeon]MBU4144380.1 hypothetical protein [Candidatus Thermoplasmatota archaeon]MBU4591325.1 hypothetical protein [Candidatus Thermoplasmatota archaeon]
MASSNSKNNDKTEELIEVMRKYQEEMFKNWNEAIKPGSPMDTTNSALFTNIMNNYWEKMNMDITMAMPQIMKGDEGSLQKQKELFVSAMRAYSDMLKEFLVSPAFLAYLKQAYADKTDMKIRLDKANDENLKLFGIVTRKDLDDINFNLYNLNKKLDRLQDAISELKGGK